MHQRVLRDIVWASHVVPAIDGWPDLVLPRLSHEHDPGGARPEQPFVRIRGEKIDALGRGGKRADSLNAVDAEGDAPFFQELANGMEIDAITGNKMTRGKGNEPGLFVDLA